MTRTVLNWAVLGVLALAAIAASAGTALAAAAPTLATGTNTPEADGVHLRGYVTPEGSAVTSCEFRYGLTSSYGQSAPCVGLIGSGTAPKEVRRTLAGLTPGATYHLQLIATNAEGTTATEDSIFEVPAEEKGESCPNEARRAEQHSTFLSDCRGYEMASPFSKLGSQVMPGSERTRAAADGSAITFSSLGGFADTRGGNIATEYMAVRDGVAGSSGWATHAITPTQPALTVDGALGFIEGVYEGEFSPDLSHGVFFSLGPLAEEPGTSPLHDLYLRDDLRVPGPGSYQLISRSASPVPPPENQRRHEVVFAGSSADFSHLIFESMLPLTSESTASLEPEVPNLFEWENGSVRLVGVIPPPGQTECGPTPLASCEAAPLSWAGPGPNAGGWPVSRPISADGDRVFFSVPFEGCDNGSQQQCGDLYMRVDHSRTVLLNASEKTNGSGSGGADARGDVGAQYWDASVDGGRIFFTSKDALTDDAPENGELKLYRYSVAPDGEGHHLTFVSADRQPIGFGADTGVTAVLGSSSDGSTVYFTTFENQLAPGGPAFVASAAPESVFAWRDGTISFIGSIPNGDLRHNALGVHADDERASRVSADGRFVAFRSSLGTGLTGYNHGSCPGNGTGGGTCFELYIYDSLTHRLSCASCNPTGTAAAADASDVSEPNSGLGASLPGNHLDHALSADGRYLFFSTAEALLPEDTNGVSDAYEYDTETGRVHLLSTGTSPDPSYFLDASESGRDAFVATNQRLVGWDGDPAMDIYDVRIGGGLPEPVSKVVCQGESCRGPASAPPASPRSGTTTFAREGNRTKPPQRPGCRRSSHRSQRPQRRCHSHHSKRHHPRRSKHHKTGGHR